MKYCSVIIHFMSVLISLCDRFRYFTESYVNFLLALGLLSQDWVRWLLFLLVNSNFFGFNLLVHLHPSILIWQSEITFWSLKRYLKIILTVHWHLINDWNEDITYINYVGGMTLIFFTRNKINYVSMSSNVQMKSGPNDLDIFLSDTSATNKVLFVL